MVKARHSHDNAYGVFISLKRWRTLAGDNIPGTRPVSLHPGGVPESAAGHPIRPILSHPKSTLAHPKSTVDLGCEPLIKIENGLISTLSPTRYRPISTPKIKGFNQTQTVTDQKIYSLSVTHGGQGIPPAKSKNLILLFSLVHPVKASPTKSNLIQHFARKKHMRQFQTFVPLLCVELGSSLVLGDWSLELLLFHPRLARPWWPSAKTGRGAATLTLFITFFSLLSDA